MKKTKVQAIRAGKFSPALIISIAASLLGSGALVCEEAPVDLAALKANIATLEGAVTALKAKAAADASNALLASEVKAKESELNLARSQAENAELKARNAEHLKVTAARNKGDADAAVRRAIARGALAAKDTATQGALSAKATDDPAFIAAIDALPGNPALTGGRMTPASVTITQEAPNATMKAYAAILCHNAKIPLSAITAKEKGKLAREAAALFAKEIEKNDLVSSMPMEDALQAADNSDATVGLLSGTLVLQRALPLLQYEYPILNSITQDFSDAPGLLNQTETTRIILKPAVQTYNAESDAAGRPKGWDTTSPAQAVNVSVTLNEHVGIPIVFGQNTLAQTIRNLFAETAPMALYALGGHLVNKVTGLMTAANFNAYKGTTAAAGVTVSGDHTIEVTSTANMFPGQAISGTGIPSNTYIASVTNSTTAELTQAATASNTGLTFTLGGDKVPNVYATYVKALADFNGASLGDIKAAFSTNEVPMQDRFALLNSSYHAKLGQDPTLNNFFAATRMPEIVTEGRLPRVQGFSPQEAPWFPTSSNRFGFAGHKASLILKTRLPQDFTSAVGGMVPGSVTTVTVPGGISVLLVQYVSLRENYAEWRPEILDGAAVGERRCGLVLTSQ